MASTFKVDLSLRESPGEAEERAAIALTEPAKAIGLHLSKHGDRQLDYKARVTFPLLLSLWRHLTGEHMVVKFEPGTEGGTHVTISGAVAKGKHAMAADPERWSEALSGS